MAHNDQNSFDDGLKKRLEAAESPVPSGLFDALMERRALQSTFESLESPVPPAVFDAVLAARAVGVSVRSVWWRWALPNGLFAAFLGVILAVLCLYKGCIPSDTEGGAPVASQKMRAIPPHATDQSKGRVAQSVVAGSVAKRPLPVSVQRGRQSATVSSTVSPTKKAVEKGGEDAHPLVEVPIQSDSMSAAGQIDLEKRLTNGVLGLNVGDIKFFPITRNIYWGPKDGCSGADFSQNKSKKSLKWAVSLETGMNTVQRRSVAGAADTAGLLAKRAATEKPLYHIQTRIMAELSFGARWHMALGLGSGHTTERMTRDSLGAASPKITYRYVPRGNGQFDTVVAAVSTQSGLYRNIRYNRYHTLDIPVAVGYVQPLGKRWQAGLWLGAYINVATAKKMDILNENLQLVDYSAGFGTENGVFKKRIGLSSMVRVSLSYALSPRVAVIVSPEWRQQWQSITVDSYAFRQRYGFYGGSIGLRTSL